MYQGRATYPAQPPVYRPIEGGATTAEQQQAALERHQQREREYEASQARRTHVLNRAKALLLSCLNPEQRSMFERENKFRVVGSRGGIYEIRQGRTHNIFKLDLEGRQIEEWCVHVEAYLPDCDNMLAQKLDLETNEDGLRLLANIWSRPSGLMIQSAQRQARAVPAQTLEEILAEARQAA